MASKLKSTTTLQLIPTLLRSILVLTCFAVRSPAARAVISSALLSAWLILLFTGWSFGGAVYLLLTAALVIFPWRQLRS